MKLTDQQVDFIVGDLSRRGIISENVRDEIIDHICSSTEEEMSHGTRFYEAYQHAIRDFGSDKGLRKVQHEVVHSTSNAGAMFRNYLTIGWRNLRRQMFFTLINVVGLAAGVAACLMIALYIYDELQYDKYNIHAHRIFRLQASVKLGGNEFDMTYRSAPEAQALRAEFPEIESTVRFRQMGTYLVRAADDAQNRKEEKVIWADSTFFRIFTVALLEGNAKTALAQPEAIAISRQIAERYFPGKSALGQTLILDNNYHATVTAVYENIPSQSHFHFDIIVSMIGNWPICKESRSTSYMSENFITYLLLRDDANPATLQSKFPKFVEQHLGPELARAMGGDFTFDQFLHTGNRYNLSMQPLTDIHLYSDRKGEFETNGRIAYVYLFGVVGLIILGIACMNFMNMTTARSGMRAKEVGVRKVMGSLRGHLIRQFLTESFLVTLASVILGMIIAVMMLPLFNNLSQKQLVFPFDSTAFYIVLLLMLLVIALLAGFYPAFMLSSFKPVSVLKGNYAGVKRSGFVRSALVVFQFTISILLVIGAITIRQQINFIQRKNLGFQKEQLLIIHDAYALRPSGAIPFKEEVLRLPGIESGTITGFVPVDDEGFSRNSSTYWREGVEPTPDNIVTFQSWSVDLDYVKTFQMKISSGRDFSPDYQTDDRAVIINETAARHLNLTHPVGQKIKRFDIYEKNNAAVPMWTIIGVVEDFHFSNMKESIRPVGLFLNRSDGSVIFRIKPTETASLIGAIESAWKRIAPGQPFHYTFLDQDFEKMYRAEQRLAKMFMMFATLAIVIACLGLFALSAFAAERRTREIGIRKVLGASVNSIVVLLSKQFGVLVLISFVIAAPAAYVAINWWLSGYSYRTTIGIWVYASAGLLAFIIALLTMSFQSIRAALINPVDSLRNE